MNEQLNLGDFINSTTGRLNDVSSLATRALNKLDELEARIAALEGANAAPADEWGTLFDGCEPLTWPGWYGGGVTNTVTLKADGKELPGDFMLTQHGWVARIFSDADFTELVDKLNPALVNVYWKHLEE